MKRVYVVAIVCAALAGGASRAEAQSVSGRIPPSDKASPSVRMAGARTAAKARVRHLKSLQRRAIEAARHARDLAGRHPMSQANVEKYALLTQKDIQAVMEDLGSASGHSSHLSDVRSHEQQAFTAAEALVSEARSKQPSASAISANADAVIQHAEAAEARLTAPTATDDWLNP